MELYRIEKCWIDFLSAQQGAKGERYSFAQRWKWGFSFVFVCVFWFVCFCLFFFFEFFFSSSKPLKPRKLKIRIQQIFYTYMKFTSFSVCLLAAIDPFNCHKNIKCYVCAESIISVSDLKLCFFN